MIGVSMERQLPDRVNPSHPEDPSLEAYMAWVMGRRLPHDHPKTLFTEAEWAAAWKEYWNEGSNF